MSTHSALQESGYILDPVDHLWLPPTEAAARCDVNADAERLTAQVVQSRDNNVSGLNAPPVQNGPPDEQDLCTMRVNALRPFAKLLQGPVLEVGAGCGIITCYLGECGADVVALESRRDRAAVASARNRHLSNIHVVAQGLDAFECDIKFKVATLLGAFDRLDSPAPSDAWLSTQLRRVNATLENDGLLILAIDNVVGMDRCTHVASGSVAYGRPHAGHTGSWPAVSGRRLQRLLRNAGFKVTQWLYAFADQRNALTVITEQGFNDRDFDANLLAWQSRRCGAGSAFGSPGTLESLWPAWAANDLARDFSNSFIVLCARESLPSFATDILACRYKSGRKPIFAEQLLFRRRDANSIVVEHEPLAAAAAINAAADHANQACIHYECVRYTDYINGHPLATDFVDIVSQDGWRLEQVADFLRLYLEHLFAMSGIQERDVQALPGCFVDATPDHLVIRDDGSVALIHRAWTSRDPVSIIHLLYRALHACMELVARFGQADGIRSLTRHDFLVQTLALAGHPVTHAELVEVIRCEWQIDRYRDSVVADAGFYLHAKLYTLLPLGDASARLEQQDRQLQMLLDGVYQRERDLQAVVYKEQAALKEQKQLARESAQRIDQLQAQLRVAQAESQSIQNSTFWRRTRHARWLLHQVKRVVSTSRSLAGVVVRGDGFANTFLQILRILRNDGPAGLRGNLRQAGAGSIQSPVAEATVTRGKNYPAWLRQYDVRTEDELACLRQHVEKLPCKPCIAVVMPTYNSNTGWLAAAIDSVRKQLYPHWQLCIADDASTDKEVRRLLRHYVELDSRIKVVYRPTNGHISAASNAALELVEASWTGLLDHDDVLHSEALLWVADAINRHPDTQIIYTDEDKIDEAGQTRLAPYFKPDWNRDLFYSHNLICHFSVYRTRLLREIGGFRVGFEGAQDYDLVLRCLERIDDKQIHHIPRVLYHWRKHADSTASSFDTKDYATHAGVRALSEHLQRMRKRVERVTLETGHLYRVQYALPPELPLASIIIPTKNRMHLLRQCIDSIFEKTTYPRFELIIVDNGSDDPPTQYYLQSLQERYGIRVCRDNRPFNYSMLNNAAVDLADGDVVALLNNDIEVITPDWLDEMVRLAIQPDIGAVGAKLLYPDGSIQHAGVILGLGGVAGHSHKHLGGHERGYCNRAIALQSLSAVTGACLVVRKSVYKEVGGLNEADLRVAFNDVDFCIRVREAGYRNVWTPYAQLFHHESASRGRDSEPQNVARFAAEVAYMKQRWGHALKSDPAYSPNLTQNHEDFTFAWPPRVARLPTPLPSRQ